MYLRHKSPSFSYGLAFLSALAFMALPACKPASEEKKEDCKKESKHSGHSEHSKKSKGEKDDCEKEYDDSNEGGTPAPSPKPTPVVLPELPGRECVVDRFQQQPQEEAVKKVDILFVMDHSGSMADDWARVAGNVQNLVKELPSDIDVRYSVLLANASNWNGRLYAPHSVPVVLSSKSLSVNQISRYLEKTFKEGMRVPDDNASGEASFLSLHSAVTKHARANQKHGFFRADAALSILFMSDEQEIGFPFPKIQAPGLPPRCDGEWEDRAKKQNYDSKGITLNSTFDAVKKFKGDMPVVTHAFVNITKKDLFTRNSKNAKCLYDSLGYGYFEMVEKTKGVLFSIQADKAQGMARCGQVIRERLALVYDFQLSRPAEQVDPETILASVDSSVVAHKYQTSTNIVHLDDAGQAGSQIQIRHCKPIQRQDWSIQGFGGEPGQFAVSLNWKTPEYKTKGKILWGIQANALVNEASSGIDAASDHLVTVEGMNPNTVYYFQAVSSDEYGLQKRSSVISLRTLPDWSITGITAQASRNNAKVIWSTAEYPTMGKVFYGLNAESLTNEAAENAAVQSHGVDLMGLAANTTYFYQILSRDEYGLEKRSSVGSFRTINDWAIIGFKGEVSRNSVALEWQTPDYATSGRVIWGLSANSLVNQTALGANQNIHSVSINGLSANTVYYFQAVSLDNLGVEKRSAVIALRTLVDWSLTGFSGDPSQTSVSLTWKTLENATAGSIQWGSTAEILNNQVASPNISTEHSVQVAGLSPDTVYYFQALSSDSLGVTKASEVVAIRTLPKPVENPKPQWEISNFSGTADKVSARLVWQTSQYSTIGTIRWGLSETNLNQEISESSPLKDHVLEVAGLSPDTLYYFQATSTDDYQQVKTSQVIAIRTLAEDPTEPPPVANWQVKSFDATTTPDSADVIWQTPGAMTKATLKIGLTPDDLSYREVAINTFSEVHLETVSGLSSNTVYYLQVVAVDKTGRTVESVVIMKRTKAQ